MSNCSGITDEGVVRLRLLGSCDGCSSSAATMSLAIEDAVSQAAPEIAGFDVGAIGATVRGRSRTGPGPAAVGRGAARIRGDTTVGGRPAVRSDECRRDGQSGSGAIIDLAAGRDTRVVDRRGMSIIICRNGADLLAFRDKCAACGGGLETAQLERRLGAGTGGGVLTCPACHVHYDVRAAGAAIDMAELISTTADAHPRRAARGGDTTTCNVADPPTGVP